VYELLPKELRSAPQELASAMVQQRCRYSGSDLDVLCHQGKEVLEEKRAWSKQAFLISPLWERQLTEDGLLLHLLQHQRKGCG